MPPSDYRSALRLCTKTICLLPLLLLPYAFCCNHYFGVLMRSVIFARTTNHLSTTFHSSQWPPPLMAPCCLIHTQHRYDDFRDVPDPYEVLQVKPTASQAEIRSAYYAQCKLFHPDRLHTNCPATSGAGVQAFQRLSAAYALLNDPATRRRYDDYRASHLGTWFRSRDSCTHPASDLDPPFDFHRARDIFHTQRASSPRRASYASGPTSTSDRPGAGDPRWNPSYWHLSNHVWQPARRWRLTCYARWCLTSYVVVATISIIGFASFCDPGN